jgi:hypothetical protein
VPVNFRDCTYLILQHHNLFGYLARLLGRPNELPQNTARRKIRMLVVGKLGLRMEGGRQETNAERLNEVKWK